MNTCKNKCTNISVKARWSLLHKDRKSRTLWCFPKKTKTQAMCDTIHILQGKQLHTRQSMAWHT